MALLEQIGEYNDSYSSPAAVANLRKAGHSPELVSAALSQARLRSKARTKFGEFADRILFTEAGLEQASRLRVAAVHAMRFRSKVTGVADLGCGIAGDSLAFAAAGLNVLAVELDEVTAALAAVNLAPFPEASVELGAAEEIEIPAGWGVWADPARRTVDRFGKSHRRTDPADFTPRIDWLLDLATSHPLGIKLGPATDLELIPDRAGDQPVEAQWVSIDGDVVEMTLWAGGLARDRVGRSALVLDADGAVELSGPTELDPIEPGDLQRYLYEPNGAVIRSRLLPLLADQLTATTFSPGIAYLTSATAQVNRFAAGFEIVAEFAADEKTIKRELAERSIGRLEIKKRGWDGDPAALRKRLSLRGANEATLILTRVDGRHRALLAHRLPSI